MTPVQAAQAGLLRRVARKHAFLVGGGTEANSSDADPLAPAPVPAPQSAPTTAVGQSPVKRKLKLSAIMDQGDDTVIGGPEAADLAAWHQRYVACMGAAPQEEEEPTAVQRQALHHRACTLGAAPYADRAVWGPYGRKSTRANKSHTWIPAHDSTYISKELPGPENFQQWLTR